MPEPDTTPTPAAALRDRIAEALMRWAEGNNNPKYAPARRPETVTKNAYSRADAVLAVILPEGKTRAEIESIQAKRDAMPAEERRLLEAGDAPYLRIQLGFMLERAQQAERERDGMAEATALLTTIVSRRAKEAEDAIARVREALREVLATFSKVTLLGTDAPVGYLAESPIHPQDFARWTAALTGPAEGMGNASYPRVREEG